MPRRRDKKILYPVESRVAERNIIRLGLDDPDRFYDILGLSREAFIFYRVLVDQLAVFWSQYHTSPDLDIFTAWCHDVDAVSLFSEVMAGTSPDSTKHTTYIGLLRDSLIGRGMLELADFLADSVGTESHPDILHRAIARLSDLTLLSSDRALVSRGLYWQTAPDRWERFKKYAEHPELLAGIPFGLQELDKATGGLHALEGEADVVAIFGKPGTYKSRIMLNMAYNQACRGVRVMYVSREMGRERVEMLLDARESLNTGSDGSELRLDYRSIEDAYLVRRYRERYKRLLKHLYEERQLPLWIIDCPDVINTADIIKELEIYHAQESVYPNVIYIDYANLVDPVGHYEQEYQRLDRLFIELLGITKGYSIPLVTPVRESRTGSLVKERDEIGIEHIGLSQSIGYHIHQLWHMDHTKDDIQANRVWVRMKKNRYGQLVEVPLFVAPEFCYVGDRDINLRDNYSGL